MKRKISKQYIICKKFYLLFGNIFCWCLESVSLIMISTFSSIKDRIHLYLALSFIGFYFINITNCVILLPFVIIVMFVIFEQILNSIYHSTTFAFDTSSNLCHKINKEGKFVGNSIDTHILASRYIFKYQAQYDQYAWIWIQHQHQLKRPLRHLLRM